MHARIHVFALPVELHHQIVLFLDIKDIIALRKATDSLSPCLASDPIYQTCKFFLALTQERGLWWSIFTRLRATQALPFSQTEFLAMPLPQAERALITASKVEASFLEPRAHSEDRIPVLKQNHPSTSPSTCSWRVITFISDSFLLSVDTTTAVIWDTHGPASSSSAVVPFPCAHFALSNFICYAQHDSMLYIADSRTNADRQNVIIYSVPIPPSRVTVERCGRDLRYETEFSLHETEQFKHMDPCSSRALLFSHPNSIHILHWDDHDRRSTISIQLDDFDEVWNGITSLLFCGPYILCFRVRSVEAYPIPTDTPMVNPLPTLRHRFGPVCFRFMSLSHVRVSRCPSGEIYTIFMLTHDVYQGMFHYRIQVTTTPVPSMSVHLLSKGGIRTSELMPLFSGITHTWDDVFRRIFFSTWSLGPAGLRGVWVDRQRGGIDRRVVAFTTHPSRLRTDGASSVPKEDSVSGGIMSNAPEPSDEVPGMDGKVVHVISSYDLRDDITICAVSEWTGRIALGSRVGAILLL